MLMSVLLTMVAAIIFATITMVVIGVHVDQVILYKIMNMSVLVSNILYYATIYVSKHFVLIADPCEPIMAPQNGSIVCTSGMVGGSTDDNCTFSCHLGFNLENSNHRTCLPNHKWSGVETYCRILQCPNLLPLPDSSVRLPCAREFTSFCTMDCDIDYYLVGNSDRLCLVVNNVTNEVGWVGQHAECDRKY